jgi:hypothetical protein
VKASVKGDSHKIVIPAKAGIQCRSFVIYNPLGCLIRQHQMLLENQLRWAFLD